ncbi:MAG TPA: ABC transporter ATP-binding protein [Vicinamibacteria bacterium]|nr:ABC transporter ATP-binding protein [Vicinamibacteria bacterium]
MLELRFALQIVWRSGPLLTIAHVCLVFVQGVLPLFSLYVMKLIVDSVAAAIDSGSRTEVIAVTTWIGVGAALALLGALVGGLARLVQDAQSQMVTLRMNEVLQKKSTLVDLQYFEDSQYYDLSHRARAEAPVRPTRVLGDLVLLGQNAVSLVAVAALLFFLHWGVALVVLLANIPDILVRVRTSRALYRWQKERTSRERRAWYYNWMITGNQFAKELRLFGLGKLFMSRYRELSAGLVRERLQFQAKRALAELLGQGISTLAVFGAFAFVALEAARGVMTIGDVVMYYQAFQRGQGYLKGALMSLAGLYEHSLFLSHVSEFLTLPSRITVSPAPPPLRLPLRQGIVFDGVHFAYPNSSQTVLEGVSFTIGCGEKVALVGENGAGKSTIVKLLCRFYDPTRGRITIDGVDLRELSTEQLRRAVSVVFQDYVPYYLTARENIWLGNVDLALGDPGVERAAERSGADEFLRRLKNGYDTVLGKWFVDGEELSVGEWQKVALARGFFREAQVIVLDEPTASVDARAELALFHRFRELTRDKTAVLISHRFSTVRLADRICVLDGGRITESGTHEQLLGRSGSYAALFEMQARQYR